MSLFDIARISPPRNIRLIRQERIKREGSPPYTWPVPVTAAGARAALYPDTYFPASKKYSPLDYIQLSNNDSVDVMLIINTTEQTFCPAGSVTTVDNIGLRHIMIQNLDGAVASTLYKIYAVLQKQAQTIDKWARVQ